MDDALRKRINEQSYKADRNINEQRKTLEACLLDKRRDQRLALCECKYCFYLKRGVAGRAMTHYACELCKKEVLHQSTAVPKLCVPCAKAEYICCRCYADLDFTPREP